jgi:cell division protein FtsW
MFRKVGRRTSLSSSQSKNNWETPTESEGVFVKPADSQKNEKHRNKVQLRFDVPLLLTVITFLIIGLVMVYSASYDYSNMYYGNATTIFYRQLIWLGIGLIGAFFLSLFNYHKWKKFALFIMVFTIVALLSVLFVNEVRNGAVRTLFGGSIQPSEMAKLAIIIYLAVWLSAKQEKLGEIGFGLIPLAILLGLFGGLIILQPDFSAVATILMLGGLMFFLAGGDLKQIGILLAVSLVIGWIIIQLSPTGSARIGYFMTGLMDPTEGSYHVRRSLEAIIKGGWFGVGIGEAETKLTGLPVPPTDSIFAVVGEETGVFGSAVLVMLFAIFMWRGFVVAHRAPDQLGMLLAGGLTLWVSLEAFINMAVMVNLLPFAGNALPFISAGGSNLIVSLAAVGIILNISRLSEIKKVEQGKIVNAVVDLRRRYRRRRLSSSRRTASRKNA